MKYTDYYNHLLIESWKTYKPSSNPRVLLYDFYVLSYLSTLPLGPEQKEFSGGLMGRNSNEVRLDIEHAQSVLLPLLVNKIKNALFLAICAEIRHIFDNPTQKWSKYENNQLLKYYVRYYNSLSGDTPPEFQYKRDVKNPRVRAYNSYYLVSYKAAMMAIKKTGSSTTAFAELAADLFNNMKWESAYGGKKWAAIAKGYLLLDKASTNNQKQVAIDHAYDLQHNTGTALNKVKDFSIEGFAWLKIALDHKRDAKSMYELLPYCSSDMKKLALEVFKIANVKKPDGIIKTNLFDKQSAYNIGDELVLNGQDYKVYGTIVDKNKFNEAFVIGDSDSKNSNYKIKITKIEGNVPKNYSVNKIITVKYKYMDNWKIIKSASKSSKRNFEYNIRDELVLNGKDYKVYGTIVDVVYGTLGEIIYSINEISVEPVQPIKYKIKITKIEGNAPKNYSVNKIIIVKYKYMENWEIIKSTSQSSKKNESNSYI